MADIQYSNYKIGYYNIVLCSFQYVLALSAICLSILGFTFTFLMIEEGFKIL